MLKRDVYLRELILAPEYAQCNTESSKSMRALAHLIADRLSRLTPFSGGANTALINKRRMELAGEFQELSRCSTVTLDELNRHIVWLFQWADTPVGEFGTQKACHVILITEDQDEDSGFL
jgi:hypothetical protein